MNIRINVIKKFLPNYKSLFFFLFFSSDFIFANEDIFKPDNDIFNDEEFNTSTEKFNFIKKMQIKNTSRIYVGAHLPIPISMGVLGKYIYDNNLNIIENEAISTNLTKEEKKEYIIYDEITKYNDTHPNSQINDCFKIKDENLLNDYMARYKVNNEDKLAVPVYFTNLLKFATIMGKINEYNNKNTECEFELHGLEGEDYKNRLGETIKSLPVLAEKSFLESCLNGEEINLDEDKKKRLEEMGLVEKTGLWGLGKKIYPEANKIIEEIKKREDDTTGISEGTKEICKDSKYKTYDKNALDLKICHLNNLKKQQKGKELSKHMTYGKIKPFKSLIYYNFNCGVSNTFWINKRIGWEVDLSGSFSYFDLKKSVFLSDLDNDEVSFFRGLGDNGNGNLEFGLLNGHILNQNILKQESNKKAINEEGKYDVFKAQYAAFNKKLYYCTKESQNTRDCATNFFVTKKFISELEEKPTGCLNIGCTLKQINVCLKTGVTINLSNPNLFLKNYRGHLFNNSHQLVFNVGCIANINFWDLNLNFDIDEKALQYEGRANSENYNKVQESYRYFLDNRNTKKMVSWLKEDFIQQYKFRPMFEIKYRLDSVARISFEIGLRFIFRSVLNFDINKAEMREFWNNLPEENIPKYDNAPTDEDQGARKLRILNKIDDFGIKWFYNFDMSFFFSIGFNIIK